MLTDLSQEVANCYQHAVECAEHAGTCANADMRAFYLEREEAWLLLARTHALTERVDLAIEEIDRQRGVTVTRACPACKQVTPIHYHTLFVCTNCRLVFEDQ